ncbi:hypothetical protein HJFPF1_00686 [Paramyrothecium foliicola]|nr:hypothetical protein HJFPF1_00686 [Paramyrothecium foliicola]
MEKKLRCSYGKIRTFIPPGLCSAESNDPDAAAQLYDRSIGAIFGDMLFDDGLVNASQVEKQSEFAAELPQPLATNTVGTSSVSLGSFMDLVGGSGSPSSNQWLILDNEPAHLERPSTPADDEVAKSYQEMSNFCHQVQSWNLHDPTTSLYYVVNRIKGFVTNMAEKNATPFLHRCLYQSSMPQCIVSCFATCVLYTNRTPSNAAMVMRSLYSSVTELLCVEAGRVILTPLEKLARTHALFLYQVIRLFDGDVALRAAGERDLSIFRNWLGELCKIRENMGDLSRGDEAIASQNQPEDWQRWIFAESVRRTIVMAYSVLFLYEMMKDPGYTEPHGAWAYTHRWTLSRCLWEAETSIKFNRMWTEKPRFVITNFAFAEFLQHGNGEDVDEFAEILLSVPYCPHCQDFLPIYQTLYEFYYTSKPETSAAKDADFSDFYDFRFGMINCVAYYDLCVSHGVQSYPLTVLYDHGEQVDQVRGVKNLTVLSEVIEPVLEKTKPGSRPKSLELPEVGDKQSPKGKASSPKADDELSSDKTLAKDTVLPDKEPKLSTDHVKEQEKPLGSSADKSSDKSSGNSGSASEKPSSDKPSKEPADKTPEKQSDDAVKSKDKTETAASEKPKSDTYKADWKVPTSGELEKEKKPKKPLMSPNPNGVSVSLTPESFQKLVTMTQDPWFIKFYAPWCPHCQAMAPTWEQLAKNMRGKLNIGEVNCDKERRLCKEAHAKAFPTLLFFKGGERAEYQGLRGLGDFIEYSEKALALANGVPDVDAETLAAMEKKDEVIFVYFYDHATTSEDFRALERLPLSLIGHGKLVKTNDPALYDRFKISTWPRLLVSREGRPSYYTPLTPNEMRDEHQVLAWMKSVWLPLVPEMTASNAKQIMDHKIVVLGVLNRENQDSFQGALREMKSAANEWMDRQIQEFQLERKKLRDAKQMRIEEAEDRNDERAVRAAKAIRIDMEAPGKKEVGFAWVDGAFWQRWIRTTYGIDVKDGERIIINDQDKRRYWDTTATGNYILVSRTSIMETLDKIVYGPHVIRHKLTVSILQKIFIDIRNTFYEHPYLSIGFLAAFMLSTASWYRNRIRRSRGGHFRLDDSLGIRDFKDGLLGHNGNAKAD